MAFVEESVAHTERGEALDRRAFASVGRAVAVVASDALGFLGAIGLTATVSHVANWHVLVFPTVICMVALSTLGWYAGYYRRPVVRLLANDVAPLVTTTLSGASLVLALLVVMRVGAAEVVWCGSLVLALLPCRLVARMVYRRLERFFGLTAPSRMLIIGSGQVGQRLAATLIKHRNLGITVVGFMDDHDYGEGQRQMLGLPLFRQDDLEDVIARYHVDHVAVAFSRLRDSEVSRLLRLCRRYHSIQISLIPRLFEIFPPRTRLFDVHGMPLLEFERSGQQLALAVKRALDVTLAALGLVLVAPLLLIAALAIWLEDRAPILFRQPRVGYDGKVFVMYKLRSMYRPREGADLRDLDATSRCTRVGRVLRNTSIDELPQLWNVVKGDMSLVGPRPEREHYVKRFATEIPRYDERHRMRGGITGLAQVNRWRGDTSIVERARLDNLYIDTWSLWLDVKIMLRTLPALVPPSHGVGGAAALSDVVAEVSAHVEAPAYTVIEPLLSDVVADVPAYNVMETLMNKSDAGGANNV